MRIQLIAFVAVMAVFISPAGPSRRLARAEEPVTITVTDKALVPDTIRLGINLTEDNNYDNAMVKVRLAENFEGVRYRMCTWGPLQDEHGAYVWFPPTRDPEVWEAMKGKFRYTILGGPAKGTTGFIKDIRMQVCPADDQKREVCYIEFDKRVPPWTEGEQHGILLEMERPTQGSIRETITGAVCNTVGDPIHIGDVPPGSFGRAALWLKGTDQIAHYAYVPVLANVAVIPGSWRVQLWAKARSGNPTFHVNMGGSSPDACVKKIEIPLDGEWEKHDLTINLPEGTEASNVYLVASEGEVLVDDVLLWKEEPGANPTAFRDICVDALLKLKPGVLRRVQMGGSDLKTNLRPGLRQMAWTRYFPNLLRGGRNTARGYVFTMHDFYLLCEYIGADPWYCVPGTLYPEETNILMEYLGAPPDVGYGKVRAGLGHPTPWTDVFDTIYVEIGNEAWNPSGYATGSYNGPDHWKDIIAIGKASPHYRENILFVAGSQAASSHRTNVVLENAPNADRVAVAPYIVHWLFKDEVAPLQSDEELFEWLFGFTARRVLHPEGSMRRQFENARAKGVELATYEHNYHMTHPSAEEDGAPIGLRNRLIASLGGGINLVNDSLHMMRELGVRSQCFFNLSQKHFREGVKLWGFTPGLNVNDQRYRPSFLATEIANHVIGGDLVETRHSAEEPTFSAWGRFGRQRPRQEPELTTYGPLPSLWSYAFKDGQTRGLILFNLDTTRAHTVRLQLPGAVRGRTARSWRLAADSIAANNEYETGEPQVKIAEETMKNFTSGSEITLPPHSMLALKWDEQ
jgi:hypothetical protein